MNLSGQTVLLTGGTGSFGNAFAERVLKDHPTTTLRIFSRDELKQSEMRARLADSDQLRFFVGDVRDRARLTRAMGGADIVVHAAAMKQVPACEYNPSEAIDTNIQGTQNVVDAAIDAGVGRVVALSTDKAVNPINLYGATKLCAEKVVIQGNSYAARSHTILSCVRYGNVIGSRGSVVPLFRHQAESGRLTITDDRMTRFWITLDAAVDLVMRAIDVSVGGEVFIPKIPSMRVTDLAEAIAPGVPTEVTGIRPGEKLDEVLITHNESRHTVNAGEFYVVLPEHPAWSSEPMWTDAAPLDDGFVYDSGTNDQWLSIEELRAQLG